MKYCLVIFVFMALVYGCSQPFIEDEPPQKLSVVEPNHPEDIFPPVIRSVEEAHVVTQIHDGLLRMDFQTNKPKGLLAKRWVVNNAQDKIFFHLHDNVYFHEDECFKTKDARKLRADDVKYSIEYFFWYKITKNQPVGLLDYIKGGEKYLDHCKNSEFEPGLLSGIIVKDSLTVVFELNRSNPGFIYNLTNPDMVVLPREGLEHYGDSCLVGCGAFSVNSFRHGADSIVLEKNSDYYQKHKSAQHLPFLDMVTFYYEPVPAKSLRMLRNNKVDLMLSMQNKHITNFIEQNISLFEAEKPELILEQAEGMENSEIYMIRRSNVKNLEYSSMNFLYLDNVRITTQKNPGSGDDSVVE